ncbi:hypothetical protein KR044_003967 [Drosophila immigrans]|nr:hypothetical protein KR044_003967 [Drosophila immigrans]
MANANFEFELEFEFDVAFDLLAPICNRILFLFLDSPLALRPGDSPYCKRFWAGHRYLEERQKLHQQLQPGDMRYKEVKILRSPTGKFFLSKTLEDELKDEKQVLDFIDSQLQRRKQQALTPEQRARQRQALDERAELDRQKQQVSEWRQRHRIHELKLAKIEATKRQQLAAIPEEQPEEQQLVDDDATPRPTADQLAMPEELKQLYRQRQQFRQQCQQTNLYNNPHCAAPWKLFAT